MRNAKWFKSYQFLNLSQVASLSNSRWLRTKILHFCSLCSFERTPLLVWTEAWGLRFPQCHLWVFLLGSKKLKIEFLGDSYPSVSLKLLKYLTRVRLLSWRQGDYFRSLSFSIFHEFAFPVLMVVSWWSRLVRWFMLPWILLIDSFSVFMIALIGVAFIAHFVNNNIPNIVPLASLAQIQGLRNFKLPIWL